RFPTQLPRIEFHDEKCSIIENLCPNYFGKVSNIFKLAAGYSDAIDKSGVGGVDSYAAEMLENAIDNVDQP
ncbi:MAG: hypothetical protein PHG55_10455, partial [Verrucomicrobiota bacterium]|nr:hypothetical protein [Verrucomicrobiota bacterium]